MHLGDVAHINNRPIDGLDGKMSVGVRRADATPKIMISSAITMKV
jgi:hypothetical protein